MGLMVAVARILPFCAVLLLALPAIAAAQCVSQLSLQRVWTQDASGADNTAFAPGEPIRFAAELNNSYGAYMLGANGAQVGITTSFYTDTKPVDIPPGVSTWTWNATVPSTEDNYTTTVRAYDHFCGVWVEARASFTVGAAENQLPPEIVRAEPFQEGVLVFFRVFFTDPNNDAEGFSFRWFPGEETHPFSDPSFGRVYPGVIEYPFNLGCGTESELETEVEVEVWIYDSAGLRSQSETVHLACSAPSRPSGISYFALGDSVASGHGLKDDATACRQSDRGYPYKVRDHLATRYTTVDFHNDLACSGATALVPSPDATAESPYKWLRNQVNEALGRIDRLPSNHRVLVSITIGANDTEFGDIFFKLIPRLSMSDIEFYAWADNTVKNVKNALSLYVKDLLTRLSIAVAITWYHNPFNTKSVIFKAPELIPFSACNLGACYERIDYVIGNLNGAFLDIWNSLNQPDRERVHVSAVPGVFKNYASPRPFCGDDPPEIDNTWIQHPTDPASNALLNLPIPDWLKNITGLQGWLGDCFHPNETGAQAYADAINNGALRLGR